MLLTRSKKLAESISAENSDKIEIPSRYLFESRSSFICLAFCKNSNCFSFSITSSSKFRISKTAYIFEYIFCTMLSSEITLKENAFSGIADGCHFTHMQQNLFFEIDESGVKEATQPSGTPDISMSLNRPFLFAIRENSTNTLMFTGKIAKIE